MPWEFLTEFIKKEKSPPKRRFFSAWHFLHSASRRRAATFAVAFVRDYFGNCRETNQNVDRFRDSALHSAG